MASAITTHVLDTATGKPALGVPVILERRTGESWQEVGRSVTNEDGRVAGLAPENLDDGVYRMSFDTTAYFRDQPHFYPVVRIVFRYEREGRHCHVPLLLSPYGYSTYRGS